MSRFLTGAAAIGFLAAMTPLPASALDPARLNGATVGMRYDEARARLLELGYSGSGRGPSPCPIGRERLCRAYPDEIEDCAGTGAASCRFVFRYPRGRMIEVATEGEDPIVTRIVERPRGSGAKDR